MISLYNMHCDDFIFVFEGDGGIKFAKKCQLWVWPIGKQTFCGQLKLSVLILMDFAICGFIKIVGGGTCVYDHFDYDITDFNGRFGDFGGIWIMVHCI